MIKFGHFIYGESFLAIDSSGIVYLLSSKKNEKTIQELLLK
jgi:hypothetical protein